MQPKHEPFNELDLMMLRAGWPTTQRDLEHAVERARSSEISCAACRWIAGGLRRAAAWFEARAARKSEA